MTNLAVDVKIADMKEFNELLENVNDLIGQIEMADFKDENGHNLKMNKAYCDLVNSMERLSKTK